MDRICLDSGKSVLLSDPYDPNTSMLSAFMGRENELRMIFASWIGSDHHPPLCPLLVGEPGVGKNRIVYELAAITGLPLYILQGHEDITAEDLACSVRFADDAQRGMDYVLSPLVTAMHQGGICFIDEIGKIRPRALSLLVNVLDQRRYIAKSNKSGPLADIVFPRLPGNHQMTYKASYGLAGRIWQARGCFRQRYNNGLGAMS